jgi:hypothetical protein
MRSDYNTHGHKVIASYYDCHKMHLLNIFIKFDLASYIIYLNETISLGKAWVLHKIKYLKCQLMPQPEKHKVL